MNAEAKLKSWGLTVVLGAIVTLVPVARAQVSINELMPVNSSTLSDSDGDLSDWFELFNGTPEAVNLQGFGLSDDAASPDKWIVPYLPLLPGDFQLIYASGKDTAGYGGAWDAVVTKGDVWRYQPGAVEPPPEWTDPGFDDAGWLEGPSGIGYGDGDDATVIPSTLSLYARIRFDVIDPSAVELAMFHMDYDDGFVAYLNGTEIARSNLGQAGIRPSNTQPATTFIEPRSVNGLPPELYRVNGIASAIRAGENILSVQVHNSSSGSSDLTCIPYLTLGLASTTGTPRPPATEIDDDFVQEFHTNFRLSSRGEALYLTNTTGQLVDSVRFGPARPDVSLGRQPDGVGPWYFFNEPTPGASNSTTAYQAIAEPPVFSHLGGRHAGPLTLTLTAAPGLEIFYTTNGATPGPQSVPYGAPISINQTEVVRARTVGAGFLPSEVVTHTYVLFENAALPVVSISTDPRLLWDGATGIYAFPPDDQASCPNFPHFCANFWEDREIEAHIEIFEPGGATGLSAGTGVTIVGGWSRAFPQKSLGLFARARYGNRDFAYALFPDRPYSSYQSFLLRNSGNDWDATLLRDGFMQALVAEADVDRMAFRPSVMYLNGEYWGIHNIREKINEHYAAALGNIDADQVDLLELNEDNPSSSPGVVGGDTEHFEQMLAFVGSADMRSAASFETVRTLIDVDNFIDYHITQIFVGNTDWPGNNVKLWRPRTPDGRWRWILFDLDFGFGRWNPADYQHNTLAFATQANGPTWPNPPWSTFLLRRLLENSSFRIEFVNRYADFLNDYFLESSMLTVLDSLQGVIDAEIPDHVARWGRTYASWRGDVDNMRFYGSNRAAAAEGHLRSFFGLASRVSFTVNATGGGSVVVNRLRVAEFPWSGLYYPTVPVAVTAVPLPGYRFAGWTGTVESQDRTISATPLRPVSLLATFEVAVPQEYQIQINEIQYNAPADMDSDDWIELASEEAQSVDLTGWTFSDGAGNTFSVPDGSSIEPGAFLVIVRNPATFSAVYTDVSPMIGGWTFGLSNGGESVYLSDDAGFPVDSLTYSDLPPWPAEPDGAGSTLELVNPRADNRLASNWRASTVRGGTPGRANSVIVGTEAQGLFPDEYRLGVPFPNPFRTSTTITYGVPTAGRIMIRVFDTLGRRVATVTDETKPAGFHSVTWDARGVPAGLYVVQMAGANGEIRSIPVVRVR